MQTNKITQFSAATLAAVTLMFGAAGVAGAQEADTTDAETTEKSTERDGNGRRHAKLAPIAEALDITPQELSEPVSYTHLTLPTTPYV